MAASKSKSVWIEPDLWPAEQSRHLLAHGSNEELNPDRGHPGHSEKYIPREDSRIVAGAGMNS